MAATTTTLIPRPFTPKRGIPAKTIKVLDTSIQFKPHHQKTLILELLKDGEMSLEAMIKEVESKEELKLRLQSKQSVFNCITYHVKDLVKLGVITDKAEVKADVEEETNE